MYIYIDIYVCMYMEGGNPKNRKTTRWTKVSLSTSPAMYQVGNQCFFLGVRVSAGNAT